MSVFIDLTQFLACPQLSGIQRVTAEICRRWPDERLMPVKFDGKTLVTVDRRIIRMIGSSFTAGAPNFLQVALASGWTRPLVLDPDDILLVPELFYDPARIAYYMDRTEEERRQFRFIVYDLIPLLHPHYFADPPFQDICLYFQMIRKMPNCGFISEATQSAYYRRLKRSDRPGGVVLRLGSDGLGPRPSAVSRRRPPTFTVIGRIERHKNPKMIVDAFKPLLREVDGLRLVFLGKFERMELAAEAGIIDMAADPSSGLVHNPRPDDDTVRKYIDESRATVFVSEAEGFGLPPVESLWRGIPVITATGIPSLEKIGSAGLHIIDPLNADNLREAVRTFLDDGYMIRKSEEALELDLPTWDGFARQVAEWCDPRPGWPALRNHAAAIS
jgi:glycosyltransferase involved in cell wall biosynthesis